MVQRFSSREEARVHAMERQRKKQEVTFWPRGYRYNDFPSILRAMMKYNGSGFIGPTT